MPTESYEFSGKTPDEAIAEGLKSLNLRPDQVTIEIINKGSRGIFGLGSEPAQVRITRLSSPFPRSPEPTTTSPAPSVEPDLSAVLTPPKEAEVDSEEGSDSAELATTAVEEALLKAEGVASAEPSDETDEADEAVSAIASELLTETIRLMDFVATVQAKWRDGNDELSEHNERYLLLNIQGSDLGALIGRRGETLDNLQYLLRLMVNQRLHRWTNIIVDVDGYKERRISQLKQLALRTATQVAASGRAVSLEPMPPNERRIIHITLRDHPDVYTESSGEGERRKVHVMTKN